MFDVDYTNYLSVDNGNGILLRKEDALVLDRYKFDYRKYNNINSLIFDIDNYLNDCDDEVCDLEEILVNLSELHYYRDVKK